VFVFIFLPFRVFIVQEHCTVVDHRKISELLPQNIVKDGVLSENVSASSSKIRSLVLNPVFRCIFLLGNPLFVFIFLLFYFFVVQQHCTVVHYIIQNVSFFLKTLCTVVHSPKFSELRPQNILLKMLSTLVPLKLL
jgi:hypothetical protein